MKNIIFTLTLGLLLGACSSNPIRTKWVDKNLRIIIDPDTVSTTDYVSIQTALVKDGRFMVIDRNLAYRAIKTEQERLHRSESDRFADKEKYAIWGRLFGAGAIVSGHTQCHRTQTFFSMSLYVNKCKQFLSVVDSNTGEVIAAIDNEVTTEAPGNNVGSESFTVSPDWSEAVAKLVDAYPKDYKPKYYSEGMLQYQEEAKIEAQKQREIASPKNEESK